MIRYIFVLLLFISKNLFFESFFTIQYILNNNINTKIFADIYIARYDFNNEKFVKIICQMFQIEFQYLIKLKLIKRFDSRVTQSITYIIYPILSIKNNMKSFTSLLIIKLSQYFIILSHL